MTPVKITKIEAARRQLDAGIRMLYSGEDLVAIHTVGMAAFGILRNLADKQGHNYMSAMTNSLIKLDNKNEFWSQLNKFANFLKHADRDPDSQYDEVSEEANDILLLIASAYYESLGNLRTKEMNIHACWCLAVNPRGISESCPSDYLQRIEEMAVAMNGMLREDKLAFAKSML